MEMYLLIKLDPTQPEQPEVVAGWTDDWSVAIAWKQSSHMHEQRWFDRPKKFDVNSIANFRGIR